LLVAEAKREKVMNTKCAAAFGFAAQLAVPLPISFGSHPRTGLTHGKTHFMGHELQSSQWFGGKGKVGRLRV